MVIGDGVGDIIEFSFENFSCTCPAIIQPICLCKKKIENIRLFIPWKYFSVYYMKNDFLFQPNGSKDCSQILA